MTNTTHAPGKVLDNGCTVPLCGRWTKDAACGTPVTCKRCLASLAKRDREFRAKARRGIKRARVPSRALAAYLFRGHSYAQPGDADRAIAREEGRAL